MKHFRIPTLENKITDGNPEKFKWFLYPLEMLDLREKINKTK